MARYRFAPGSPPNFSYHIIDTDVTLVIPQFQQMIVCGLMCLRINAELEIGDESEVVIL